MRTEYRPAWAMTTILLVSLAGCFLLQWIATDIWGGVVDDWFALSKRGLMEGRIYELITFQFMHAGFWHLFGNMFALYFFGRAMEEALGRWGMLKLYLLSGTMGGLLQVAFAFALPEYFASSVVGASAGLFGLIAAFATRAPDQPITMFFYIFPLTFKARLFLLGAAVWAILGILGSFPTLHLSAVTGNIAHAAHLGGMITGIVFIRMGSKQSRPFEFWRPFARRSAPQRELVSATPRRGAFRGVSKPLEDLPPAEFISREVDPILDKISAHGIHSLTERERQVLEAARNKVAKR